MLFNSLTFVAFFAIVLALHNLPLPWRLKKFNLLVASYLFYAAWSPPFVALLWLSTVVDFFVSRAIDRAKTKGSKRAFLLLSIATNLGVLGYFKYGGFLLDNFTIAAQALGFHYAAPSLGIVLPVGISFYTFVTLAYSLDIYLGRARPTASFGDFALFVTFFPHLVAGPIVRPTDLLPQFREPHVAKGRAIVWGLALMTLGLWEKVVLADGFLAPAADSVFGSWQPLTTLDAWIGMLAFSGQIFFDFAGYSTTAIGCAFALGFALPNNFAFPYASIGFSDFWHRWHMSLSTWLRDYLYIPLGGSRKGRIRTYVNLMLTMLIGGLWHGASWTFVMWGGLHGSYLAIERAVGRRVSFRPGRHSLWMATAMLGTFLVVSLTWIFFRAHTFADAAKVMRALVSASPGAVPVLLWNDIAAVVTIVVGMLAVHWAMRRRSLEDVVATASPQLLAFLWIVLAAMLVAQQGSTHAFIYFQF